jgi:hypothetical protein
MQRVNQPAPLCIAAAGIICSSRAGTRASLRHRPHLEGLEWECKRPCPVRLSELVPASGPTERQVVHGLASSTAGLQGSFASQML